MGGGPHIRIKGVSEGEGRWSDIISDEIKPELYFQSMENNTIKLNRIDAIINK